jgi:hypothetical protein
MLKYKGNVNAVDSKGLTPLLIAVSLDPFLQLTSLFKYGTRQPYFLNHI